MSESLQSGSGSEVPKSKTVFLVNNLGIGGSERKIVRIANELAKRGHQVGLAYLSGPEDLLKEVSPGIDVIFLNRKGKFSLKAVKALVAYVKHSQACSIFSVNLYPALYAVFVRLLAPGLRWICLLNTTTFTGWVAEARMLLYAPVLYLADNYVFGSLFQMKLWNRRYHLSVRKSLCIYNGVDTEIFCAEAVDKEMKALRAEYNLTESMPVIGTVGKMRPEKRQDLILDAVALLRDDFPDIRGLIVGDGELESHLKQYSRDLGVEKNIIFFGAQMDVRPALALMDAFVLTSTSVETFSNAALEAMSMSRPVVLSDISGAREMVDEGVNGYISIPGNANDLADNIRKIINDPGIALAMGKASRTRVEEIFTNARMLDGYEELSCVF